MLSEYGECCLALRNEACKDLHATTDGPLQLLALSLAGTHKEKRSIGVIEAEAN